MMRSSVGDGKPECWQLSICQSKPPDFCEKVTRDLQFHNDQWHFLKAMLLYLGLTVATAIFVGLEGLTEHAFPAAYAPIANRDATVIKILYAFGTAIAAGLLTTIMLETHTCFLKTILCTINIELRKLWTQVNNNKNENYSIPSKDEMSMSKSRPTQGFSHAGQNILQRSNIKQQQPPQHFSHSPINYGI